MQRLFAIIIEKQIAYRWHVVRTTSFQAASLVETSSTPFQDARNHLAKQKRVLERHIQSLKLQSGGATQEAAEGGHGQAREKKIIPTVWIDLENLYRKLLGVSGRFQ